MHADVKGALKQINKSWRAFTHRGKPMSKDQVRIVLEYAVARGHDHTGLLKDEEIDKVLGLNVQNKISKV